MYDNTNKRTEILADYMRSTFDLNANHPGVDTDKNIDLKRIGPPEGSAKEPNYKEQVTGKFLWEVEDHDKDICQLVNSCFIINAASFVSDKCKKNTFYCRMNCGVLDNETNQTPGFQL